MPVTWSTKKLPLDAHGFNERERDMLGYIAKGYKVPDAAVYMGISKHTMRDYLASIFRKLNASTQAEAVYQALKRGVIT